MEKYTIAQAEKLLLEHFGYAAFHAGQKSLIQHILDGQDVLGIMPTGAGKSVCYQIPALMLPGITVIVSPLISLMKDQVDGLRRMGISAALLNSSISMREMDETYYALQSGEVKLLYIAPERLEAEGFLPFLSGLNVSMLAIDEAHCVSQWGHDFRPSYRRIREMIDAFPVRPIVGTFTATATDKVRQDVLELLGLRSPYVLCTGFDRANLYFAVHSPADKDKFVLDYLRANSSVSGIIYCLTRKQVDKLAGLLSSMGFSALPYHAGLSAEERKTNQNAFQQDTVNIIVATNAFGMGIDKSNVRFVIHNGMPKTLENYYQEAGRAGRDGERADCVLLYSAQDIITNRFLIDSATESANKAEDYKKLQDMIDYCNVDTCLRAYILRYFGETQAPEHCGNCLNCTDDGERTDITVEAQKIISCIKRMGNRFGSLLVAQVLRGADTQKIRSLQFNTLSTYGIMREYSEKSIKEIISYLVAKGYLEVVGGEYPVLVAGANAMRFLKEKRPLFIKRAINTRDRQTGKALTVHSALFEQLRVLRKEIAAEQDVPPYVIFSDATLSSMCSILPRDREEMLLVSGVGKYKLEQYGDDFIFAIKLYMDENGIEPPMRNKAMPVHTSAQRDKPQKVDTVLASYELYAQGKSVDEIASERLLAATTIEIHLINAMRLGKPVNVEDFIPEKYRKAIFSVIEEQGTERLKPIKDALPEEVTYTAIRFAVELYKDGKR